MKKLSACILFLIFTVHLARATEVCVVADYGKENGNGPDSKCITIDKGKSGYELMQEIGWNLLWTPESAFGHMLCKINDIGTEVNAQTGFCEYSGEFWNLVLNRNKKWVHLPVGFDGPGGCWNYDIDSWNGHYCTNDGDVLGFAFGKEGTEPKMFKINVTNIYVDGDKISEKDRRKGKIEDVFPESTIELKIELENLYDSATEIDILDVSIKGVIEEINDGNDIEEEISEFDLKADRKKTERLRFTIPLEVEEKDRLLKIEIDTEDDAGISYEEEFTYDLEIKKEAHDVRILKAELNKDPYRCGENGLLELSFLNVGASEEDVNLEIVNKDLNIDIRESFKLSDDVYEESSRYEKRFNLWLPDDVSNGTYPIKIIANYGGDRKVGEVNLHVSECEKVEKGEEIIEIEVQTEEISEEEGTEAEVIEEEMTTTEEKINKNLPAVLIGVLGVLVVLITVLFVVFWVVRR